MKRLFLLALLPTLSFAHDLRDCEKKISDLINQVKTTTLKVDAQQRVDQYHLGVDQLCGIELTEHMLTVTKFKSPKLPGELSVEAEKFETIMLNGNDPTFSGGRVKAQVSCEISGNNILYTTKVPVLTDGVKSPFVIEELSISQESDTVRVSLRASLTPVKKVFRSITDCTLSLD